MALTGCWPKKDLRRGFQALFRQWLFGCALFVLFLGSLLWVKQCGSKNGVAKRRLGFYRLSRSRYCLRNLATFGAITTWQYGCIGLRR